MKLALFAFVVLGVLEASAVPKMGAVDSPVYQPSDGFEDLTTELEKRHCSCRRDLSAMDDATVIVSKRSGCRRRCRNSSRSGSGRDSDSGSDKKKSPIPGDPNDMNINTDGSYKKSDDSNGSSGNGLSESSESSGTSSRRSRRRRRQ